MDPPRGGGDPPRTALSMEWDRRELKDSERCAVVCSSMLPYCRSLWQKPSRLMYSDVRLCSSASICMEMRPQANSPCEWSIADCDSLLQSVVQIPAGGKGVWLLFHSEHWSLLK